MALPEAQDDLAARIRGALDPVSAKEVRMFSSLAFMVDEEMLVAAQKDGGLLVRVEAARSEELLALPGARQAEMGAGRSMGPSWISVDSTAIAEDDDLSLWIRLARERPR